MAAAPAPGKPDPWRQRLAALSSQIATALADGHASPPGDARRRAAQHGALMLMGTLGAVWGLRPDGSFIDIQGMDAEGPVVPLVEHEHVTALAYGAQEHPWLADALPRPATRSRICLCDGARFLQTMACPYCMGLGFIDWQSRRPARPATHCGGYIDGTVFDYNEQGMEASYFLCFEPQPSPGERPRREDLRTLQAGDRLALWDDAGELIWSGSLAVRRRMLRPNLGPQHRLWSPPGVSPAEWLAWFRTRPHLRAWCAFEVPSP